MAIEEKLENLTNEDMIDLMHHHWTRFQSVNSIWINKTALWQRWIRL